MILEIFCWDKDNEESAEKPTHLPGHLSKKGVSVALVNIKSKNSNPNPPNRVG